MYFLPNDNFVKVSLKEGLLLLKEKKINKLYSDGLESNEFIVYYNGKYYYEDNTYLHSSYLEVIKILEKWSKDYDFYYKKAKEK